MIQNVPGQYQLPIKANKQLTYTNTKLKDQLQKLEYAFVNDDITNFLVSAFDIFLSGNIESIFETLIHIYVNYVNFQNIKIFELLFEEYCYYFYQKKLLKKNINLLINNQDYRNQFTNLITVIFFNNKKNNLIPNLTSLENDAKKLIGIEPSEKINKINEIILNKNLDSNINLVIQMVISLHHQHDDNFYKSCSLQNHKFNYLLMVWDILLRQKNDKEIKKILLISFNLYQKGLADYRVLIFYFIFLTKYNQIDLSGRIIHEKKILAKTIEYQLKNNLFIQHKFIAN